MTMETCYCGPEHRPRRSPAFTAEIAAWIVAALVAYGGDAFADGAPFFSSAQTAQGHWEYSQKCAVCHGAQLQGTGAPALKGRTFNAQWNGKKLADLYSYIHTDMPLGLADSLPPRNTRTSSPTSSRKAGCRPAMRC
jgi:cytochrome c